MSLCDSALSPTVKEVQGIIDACESINCCDKSPWFYSSEILLVYFIV